MVGELIFIGSVSVLRSGSLYRITIPKKVVEELELRQGEKLLVYLDRGKRTIIIKKP
mgnify:FL=1